MRDALRPLRESIEVPPIDPARERALLEAFDRREPAPRLTRWGWAVAAALTLTTSALVWVAATGPAAPPAIAPPVLAQPLAPLSDEDLAEFVPWPGADALPPFESGEVRRIELPVTALPELGLPDPVRPAAVVMADVIIGRDGFARAVRVVQGEGEHE